MYSETKCSNVVEWVEGKMKCGSKRANLHEEMQAGMEGKGAGENWGKSTEGCI